MFCWILFVLMGVISTLVLVWVISTDVSPHPILPPTVTRRRKKSRKARQKTRSLRATVYRDQSTTLRRKNNKHIHRKVMRRIVKCLRHGTATPRDDAAYVPMSYITNMYSITSNQLWEIVRNSNKSRLQITDGKIRARNGHSVISSALDMDLLATRILSVCQLPHGAKMVHVTSSTFTNPHGVDCDMFASIKKDGVLPMRDHSHWAMSWNAAKRWRPNGNMGVEMDLERFLSDGEISIYMTTTGIIMCQHPIPFKYLTCTIITPFSHC